MRQQELRNTTDGYSIPFVAEMLRDNLSNAEPLVHRFGTIDQTCVANKDRCRWIAKHLAIVERAGSARRLSGKPRCNTWVCHLHKLAPTAAIDAAGFIYVEGDPNGTRIEIACD